MLVGQIERLKDMGEWSVPARDSLDGRFQAQEAFLLDISCQLRAKSLREWRLVGNYYTASFASGLKRNILLN